MSASNDGNLTPRSQRAAKCFDDLLEAIIADTASECHRIARLGLDRSLEAEEDELRQSHASDSTTGGSDGSSKHGVDIFGNSHPAIASEIFECMNCGRPIVAGRFAPHLEKCMGKGRKARVKATRSSTIARNRNSRGSPVSVYAPYSTSNNNNNNNNNHRAPNGGTQEFSDYNFDES